MKEMILLSLQAARTTQGLHTPVLAESETYRLCPRDWRITSRAGITVDKKIEIAIAVIVAKVAPVDQVPTVTPAAFPTSVKVPS